MKCRSQFEPGARTSVRSNTRKFRRPRFWFIVANFFNVIGPLCLLCTGAIAAASKPGPARPVWPPAPDEPKLAYVASLHDPLDVGQSPSVFKRIGRLFTGDNGEDLALQKPFGTAVDQQGNLCITDTGAKRIVYCDFARRKWQTYSTAGKIRFSSPVSAAHGKEIFYVADSELCRVLAFRPNGALQWQIAEPLVRPVGLALNRDLLAVVDSQAHAVFVFGLDGKLRFQFGKRGVGPGEFNFPTHIAFNRDGNWLVTDSMNSRIEVFDRNGRFLSQFGGNGDTSGHFGRPKGIAADSQSNIYVADALFDNFQIFDPHGQLLLNVGQTGTGPGQFGMPAGIAIDEENRIYVADSYNHRVQVFQYLGGHR